jgi:hypothetical protein
LEISSSGVQAPVDVSTCTTATTFGLQLFTALATVAGVDVSELLGVNGRFDGISLLFLYRFGGFRIPIDFEPGACSEYKSEPSVSTR